MLFNGPLDDLLTLSLVSNLDVYSTMCGSTERLLFTLAINTRALLVRQMGLRAPLGFEYWTGFHRIDLGKFFTGKPQHIRSPPLCTVPAVLIDVGSVPK